MLRASGLEENSHAGRRIIAANPDLTLDDNHTYGYLDAPNGETWIYAGVYNYEEIKHEYYTERLLKSFTFTVYDSRLQKVGEVTDELPMIEGDVRVAGVYVDALITKRFFNTNDNYELVVSVAMNRTDYSLRLYSNVYSLGTAPDENGHTPVVTTLDGFINDVLDGTRDSWSEDFYISILKEGEADESLWDENDFSAYAASQMLYLTTYKKASYGGTPQPIGNFEVSVANQPGDMMNCPFFFSEMIDGTPTFYFQRYEKWFFDNAVGPMPDYFGEFTSGGAPNADNNLLVDVYTYPGWGSSMDFKGSVVVPMTQEDSNPDVMHRYYSTGQLNFGKDVDFERGFIDVCIQKYQITDDDSYLETYARYTLGTPDADGKIAATPERNIIENTQGTYSLHSIPGQEDQLMFIILNAADDESVNTTGVFHFIDFPSGIECCAIPTVYQNLSLRANLDRYPTADSYNYAISTVQSEYEGTNVIEQIAWFNADGDLDHIERVNLGKNLAMGQSYIDGGALSPFIFNTDNAREYMWLVKRYRTSGSSQTDTWLMVASTNGETIFELGPDAEKGDIRSVSLINTETNPLLWIVYYNGNTDISTQDFYTLPFEGPQGAGTMENPYKIATYGDFLQIGKNPSANYIITQDIKADGLVLPVLAQSFTGSIDGQGHIVEGLRLTGEGMFKEMYQPAAVRNITFVNCAYESAPRSYGGIISANMSGTTLENVHVHGLTITGETVDCTFGGLGGTVSLYSQIKGCSVTAATIELPQSCNVGAIAGQVRTGASITNSSVAATIHAKNEVGGIAGSISNDVVISDCHATVDIVADNTVGGIVGSNTKGQVYHCYVEGSIKAVAPFSPRFDEGPCAGGIVGYLSSDYASEREEGEVSAPVVYGNYVALSCLEGYTPAEAPSFQGHRATIHRIVGRTQVNEAEIVNYTSAGKPIYGVPGETDTRLKDNYASSYLDLGEDGTIPAEATSTEGADIDPYEVNPEWLTQNTGITYGEGEHDWNEISDFDPALRHEKGNFCLPEEMTVAKGANFNIDVVFTGKSMPDIDEIFDSFSYNCNEEIAIMTGDANLRGNILSVNFDAVGTGSTQVEICGAKCELTVIPDQSGITAPELVASATIAFDGEVLSCPGCTIEVYNIAGVCVARGTDSVSVAKLASGSYLARASGNDDSASVLKFIVR